MAKRVNLPAGLCDSTSAKGLVQPFVTERKVVNDGAVEGGTLIVHAPTSANELQLAYKWQKVKKLELLLLSCLALMPNVDNLVLGQFIGAR